MWTFSSEELLTESIPFEVDNSDGFWFAVEEGHKYAGVDHYRIYGEETNRGATLKATREAAGFTPGEVAQRLGVSLREITRLEAGHYGDEPLLKSLSDVINTVCDL